MLTVRAGLFSLTATAGLLLRRRLATLAVAAAGLLALYAVYAGNTAFTVNSSSDESDAKPGDGICATAGGFCTLRAALEEANATSGAKTINFNLPGCSAGTGEGNAGTSGTLGEGLAANYFNNMNLTGTPVLSRNEAVDFDFGTGSPAASVNTDNFSGRWSGMVTIPASGNYRFQTNSDDGVRLWLDGVQVINNWTDHGPTDDTTSTLNLTAGQTVSVRLEWYERGGGAVIRLRWETPGTPGKFTAIPIAQLTPVPYAGGGSGGCTIQPTQALPVVTAVVDINGQSQPGWVSEPLGTPGKPGTGLAATYFNNMTLTGNPVLSRNEAVDFDFGGGSPAASVNVDQFSGRWSGTVTIPTSGSYRFQTNSDDGVRLWLDGAPVIDNWTDHGPTDDTTSSLKLTAGQTVSVRLEWYENGGGAVIRLRWETPSTPGQFTAIPIAQLTPATYGSGGGVSWTSNPLVELAGTNAGSSNGLTLQGGSSTVRGLIINRFARSGIELANAGGNNVQGNWIGVNYSGTSASPNGADGISVTNSPKNVIGGSTAAAHNVISGNAKSGIALTGTSSGTLMAGNYIGLDPSGNTRVGNGGTGISVATANNVVGGNVAAAANVISGNGSNGISVAGNANVVQGNYIGTDGRTGTGTGTGLGNGGSGVVVLSGGLSGVSISFNTLADNGGAGVGVAGGGPAQVLITANAMSGNGGLGIDLGNDGVTANTGVGNASLPNQGINMPVINGAGVDSGNTSVTVDGVIGTGAGQAAFAGARVEFFKAAVDATGYGEGQVYLGYLTADASGRFSGSVAYSAGALNVGDAITATATDAAGNTSEFSANRTTTTVAALTPGNFNAFDATTSTTAATALAGPITSKVAGAAASFTVIALDNSGTALNPGYTGTVSLNWVDARDDSGAPSGTCRASWVDKGSAGTATFSNNSRVTVALTPPPSGTRVMRLKMTYTGGGSTVTACSNDAFAVLPASYSWTGASDADSSTAGTARALDNTAVSGGVVHRAGRPFTVRARALDATGALMTGYDGSPVLAAAGCLLPSGCTAAALTAPGTAASAGAYTNHSVSYAEVGALQLQLTDASYAAVDAADTAIGVRTLTSSLLPVGRFMPDSLSVAFSTSGQLATANAACLASGAGATFIGQGFGWATAPQVTVTALNAAGATTARWTGGLMKLIPGAGLAEVLTAGNTGGATFSASYGTVTVTDLGAGQARVTTSTTDRFLLDRASGSVQDSTTPTWAWSLGVTDGSEAAVAGNPTLAATANQGSVAFNSGGVFHSGRLSLSPGYGDVRSGMRLLAQLQRYTAAGWVTMTEDQGCVTVQNQNVGVEAPTGVFATLGACAAPMTGSVTTRGGRAWLALPATPAGAPGRLTLRLAGPAATGNSCTAAGASAALLPLAPNWLLGGASAVGPQALATWGKPQRDALLRRETW